MAKLFLKLRILKVIDFIGITLAQFHTLFKMHKGKWIQGLLSPLLMTSLCSPEQRHSELLQAQNESVMMKLNIKHPSLLMSINSFLQT